jgi:hypothetical protein
VHVEYRILGPLDVIVDGSAVALGGREHREPHGALLGEWVGAGTVTAVAEASLEDR